MSDDETLGLILGLFTLCCCCGGLLVATGAGLFFFMRRRKPSASAGGPSPAAHTDPAPPDAVRQALLALNRSQPPKPYVVRLDGDKVVCEWAPDHTLAIMLDESTHTAHLLASEGQEADRIKSDMRQALGSAGWIIYP